MLCPLFCYYLQFHYNLRIFLHVFYIIFTWIYFLLLFFFLRFGYCVAIGYLLYSLFIWVPFFLSRSRSSFFSIQTLRLSIYHPHYFPFKYTSVPLFSVHTEIHSCLQIILYFMFPPLLPIGRILLFFTLLLPRPIFLRFPLFLSLLLSYRVTCCYIVVPINYAQILQPYDMVSKLIFQRTAHTHIRTKWLQSNWIGLVMWA